MKKTTKKLLSILFTAVLSLAVYNFSFSQNVNVTPNAASYTTLGAAFTAINAGAHGNGAVTISIKGNTTELASAILNGGVFTSCSITPTGARTITGNLAASVIDLSGADNVTIDGLNSGGNSLTVVNPNAALTANGLQCSNGANNNTIRKVTTIGAGASGSTAGGRGIHIGQSTAGTGGNNDNIIDGCTTNGFRRGIQTFGTAGLFINERSIVRNCKVKNWTGLGIFLGSETRDNLCEGNEVFYDAAVANDLAGCRSINIQGCGTEIVRSNKIHDLTGTVAGGYIGIISIPIIFTAPIPTPVTKVEIYNNMVALNNVISSAPFVYGIYPVSNTITTNYTVNVYFNSIRIGGSSGATPSAQTFGLVVLQDGLHGPDTSRVCNNISLNARTGGDAASLHIGQYLDSEPGVSLEADHNLTQALDTAIGWDARYGSTLYRGPAGNQLYWDSTINTDIEQMTVFDNVHFVSNTDLHLAGKIGGNMDAKNIPGITTDIDGDSRDITSTNLFTYRGADEHLPTGGNAWRKGTRTILFSLQGTNFFDRAIGDPIPDVDVSIGKKPGGIICHSEADTIGNNLISLNAKFGDSITAITPTHHIILNFTNAIRTATGLPVSLTAATGTYDFTTSLSQVYGNNMYGTSPPYQIYVGDVNQDDVIDASDLSAVDNDGYNFVIGLRIRTDVNYDGVVDASDASIVDNNVYNFVTAVIPPGYENASFILNTNNVNTKNSTMRKPVNIHIRDNAGLSN